MLLVLSFFSCCRENVLPLLSCFSKAFFSRKGVIWRKCTHYTENISTSEDWVHKLWMYFHRQRLRWQQKVKVIQKSAEVPAEYFSYAPSEAGSWGERPRSSRHRKNLLSLVTEALSPASVRIPRHSRAIPGICAVEWWPRDKVTPSKAPVWSLPPSQAASTRLCKVM